MPAVAKALVADLSALEPAHASYFQANAQKFDQSLQPWLTQLKQFAAKYPGTAVATTEPVADYMLQAARIQNLTPFSMQADIMNGTDPAPQSVALQDSLFSGHKVKVFVYNQQVTDTITQNFLKAAHAAGIPVVGVYETMPTPGYDYQSWMMAEIHAIEKAVTKKVSTEKLGDERRAAQPRPSSHPVARRGLGSNFGAATSSATSSSTSPRANSSD